MGFLLPFAFFASTELSITTFDTIYGSKDLIGVGKLSFMDDHLGNSRWCKMKGWGNQMYSTDASLLFPTSADHSGCGWIYYEDWETGGTSGGVDIVVSYNAAGGQGWRFTRNDARIISQANLASQNNVLHGLAGSGWHFVAWTRDVTNTVTKAYLDGVQIDTDNVAAAYTAPTAFYVLFMNGSGLQDVWIQKDTVWSPTDVQALYDAASISSRYLAETDFPNTTNLYGWQAKVVA